MNIRIIIFLILSVQMICQGQDYQNGQCIYTNAYSGLNLRNLPNLNGTVLNKLPIGSEIEVLEVDENLVNINGDIGFWLKVDYYGSSGYLFSRYVQEDQVFHRDKYCNIWQNISRGLKLNSIIIDSLEVENDQSGEGFHNSTEFNWSNGILQIEHVESENITSEFVVPKTLINRDQIINLLIASFDYCNSLSTSNREKILTLKSKKQINYLMEFSSIQLEETDDNIVMKLNGGP